MKRAYLAFLLIVTLAFGNATAIAAVKAGSACPKLGATSSTGGKKFTCVKNGSKLIWNKGVVVKSKITPAAPVPAVSKPAAPTADTYAFSHYCDPDPFVPAKWKPWQDKELSLNGCPPPYRYVVKELGSAKPATAQSALSELQSIEACKNPESRIRPGRALISATKARPTVIQVVPFYMNNGAPTTTPAQDWDDAHQFALDAIANMSDQGSEIQIRMPSSYIYVDDDLKRFGLGNNVMHGDAAATGQRWDLINTVTKVADPQIDFSGADAVWFLAPSNVKRTLLGNQIAYGRGLVTKEKTFNLSSYISSPISDLSKEGFQAREPFGFVHELMHLFDTADDHYGDHKNDLGTGAWGNMSGAQVDFLAWDKWTFGWLGDSQVRCAPLNMTSTHWVKPSTIKGAYEKLLLIPVSKTKLIAVESVRNSGFNFKLPVPMLGAIVYTIDTKVLDQQLVFGTGINVLCPAKRSCDYAPMARNFSLSGAALKTGESISALGYRISVVESGEFGDVIKVEVA
jgi:hypothetical protein